MIRGIVAIPSSPSFQFTKVPKDADFEVTCDVKASNSTMTKHSDTRALDQIFVVCFSGIWHGLAVFLLDTGIL
jgi:hypothetical protein